MHKLQYTKSGVPMHWGGLYKDVVFDSSKDINNYLFIVIHSNRTVTILNQHGKYKHLSA